MKRMLWIAVCLGLALLGRFSDTAAAASAPAAPHPAPAAAVSDVSDVSDVPAAAAFDPVAATQAYLATVPADKRERSDNYFEGGYWLLLWSFLWGLAVSWVLLASGLSVRLRNFAERVTGFRFVQRWLYSAGYLLLTFVLGFPLALYSEFFREHKYQLATQAFPAWMMDQLKGLGIGVLLGGIVLAGLYGVLHRAPRTWWIWGTVVLTAFLFIGILIKPVFIEPLFNKYTELRDPAVRDPILSMARANGIPAQKVYLVDASRQSTRVSANVSGALGTMRIALNDNLLKRASPGGIQMVMGHEMGHYVLNHIYEMIFQFSIVLLVGFAFVRWAFARALATWGSHWGIRDVADPAGLPLLEALLSIYLFVATPVLNNIIRTNEAEADIFGINASRQPDGFAQVALMLGEYRKLHPGPVEEWIFFDHPSGYNRILMAMKWKAEHLNDPDIRAMRALEAAGTR
jgi:STE24 endopeptidase